MGSLHGVPITIKEQYRVAGTQTTLGAVEKIGNVYHDEGPLVSALRRAGAVILGKTNVLQTLAGWECDNAVYGRTNNPWDLSRSPGGSSGGEGAIIAAGGSPLGLAGDYGGSIRVPAHFCGVHGFKPTAGRLTNDDFASGLLSGGQEVIVPQPGPLARRVVDLELAMSVLAATSMKLTWDLVAPVPWVDGTAVDVAGLRIAMFTDNGYFAPSPAIRRVVEDAAAALRDLGAVVEPIEPPDASEAVRLFLRVASAAGSRDIIELLGDEDPIPQVAGILRGARAPAIVKRALAKAMARRGQHHLSRQIESAHACSALAFQQLVEQRNTYRMQFLHALDAGKFDVMLCPPVAVPAFTHGSSEHLFPAVSYALVPNALGAPAGVVSLSRVRPGEETDRTHTMDMADITAATVEAGSAGLPVGVQVVGRHWQDHLVLAVMGALEQQFVGDPDYPASVARVV